MPCRSEKLRSQTIGKYLLLCRKRHAAAGLRLLNMNTDPIRAREQVQLVFGLFCAKKQKAPCFTQRFQALSPWPRGKKGASNEHRPEFAFPWAGSDSRPAPSTAGRSTLATHSPIRLPWMGSRTPAGSLPLAQGRASAVGRHFPPAFQRVCGDHAKLLTVQ